MIHDRMQATDRANAFAASLTLRGRRFLLPSVLIWRRMSPYNVLSSCIVTYGENSVNRLEDTIRISIYKIRRRLVPVSVGMKRGECE